MTGFYGVETPRDAPARDGEPTPATRAAATREQLARLIFMVDNANANDPAAEWEKATHRDAEYARVGYRFDLMGKSTAYAYAIADGLLAAGWTPPEDEADQ